MPTPSTKDAKHDLASTELLRQLRSIIAQHTDPQRSACVDHAAALRELATLLGLVIHRPDFVAAGPDATMAHDPVREALLVIGRRYQEHLSTSDVARAVGKPRSDLARLFQQRTGTSVHQHISDLRFRHAIARLAAGEKIEAVSLLVGYRSKKTLYRQCVVRTSMTPGALKRLLQTTPGMDGSSVLGDPHGSG